jgi:hypothetical protein
LDRQDADAWFGHVTRATVNMQGFGAVGAATGDLIQQRMAVWTKAAQQ